MDYGGGYSTTSYNSAGGADSGGFLPGGSQDSPNAKRRYGKDTLRPVTIKQIHLAELPHPDADAYLLDGQECTQITFIGQIMNISQQATNVTYKIDDGTGQIEAKVWVDPEKAEAGEGVGKELKEQGYVRCWGKIKSFGRKHVVAHAVKPVQDYNEVNYHLLESAVVHLQLTRGPPGGGGGKANGGQGEGHQNGGYGGGGDKLGNASSAARKVFQCIEKTPQGNEGLHMQDIAMRTGMEVADVLKAGDELQSMGVIYTTVDDHTWALLDLA
ncbi:Replication protein A-like protein [Elsinoe fawcettii]|nr:Replication protein A-like protein [Elsinoe fawcettii]